MSDVAERTAARIVGSIFAGRVPLEECAGPQVAIVRAAVALLAIEQHGHMGDGFESDRFEPGCIWMKYLGHSVSAAGGARP